MENFFIEDKFFSDLSDLMDDRDINEDELSQLKDDWHEDAEGTTLEPIITIDDKFITDLVDDYIYDANIERFPEDCDKSLSGIKKAIKEAIDIEKLKELMPKLYYPNGAKIKITKQDLIDYCA